MECVSIVPPEPTPTPTGRAHRDDVRRRYLAQHPPGNPDRARLTGDGYAEFAASRQSRRIECCTVEPANLHDRGAYVCAATRLAEGNGQLVGVAPCAGAQWSIPETYHQSPDRASRRM